MDNIWQPAPEASALPAPEVIEVQIIGDGDDTPQVDPATGSITIPTADGGVIVDFNPDLPDKDTKFDANLAMHLEDIELSRIAEDLLQGIRADDESRAEWLATRERGIDFLGFQVEQGSGDVSTSSAPLEGQSRVRHPVLAQAVLTSQATACGELLPASGPVKIKIIGEATALSEELAEALESDFNDYLTNRAKEYYPDTRRALFWSSFGGSSFKKVYSCPIRQRPVSESVDAKDVIVSATATDLSNAVRVTHQITMRQSVMKRMQVMGAYRDVALSPPTAESNPVTDKEAQVSGIALGTTRPDDQPYTIYECYCELDLNQFAPKQFKGKAIPLPYRVTIEKDSRAVLEIRRNWRDDDAQCLARKCLVKYPYVEGIGIYGIGLLQILGNANSALTAAWRIMLDNGMFANFPGGVVDKAASKQLSNQFRAAPGSFIQLDFGGRNANQVMGQLPYRDVGPGFLQFIGGMQETIQRLAGSAEIQVGEGRQDAPVGTTLAMIEQATKIQSEVHKGLHTAQAEEFQLLKERFQEDPGALWRHCTKSESLKLMTAQSPTLAGSEADEDAAEQKRKDMFIAALNSCELVPAADPNTPSHTHRVLKLGALKQAQMGNPNIDQDMVDKMIVRGLGFDPAPLWKPPSATPPPPDPKLLAAQAAQQTAQSRLLDSQTKAKTADVDAQIEQAKLVAQQRIAELGVQREAIIHQSETQAAQRQLQSDNANAHLDRLADLHKHYGGLAATAHGNQLDRAAEQYNQGLGHAVDLQSQRMGHAVDLHNGHQDRLAALLQAASKGEPVQ